MLPLDEWQTLLSVQAESAATLTGPVFVAVSINLQKVLSSPGLPGRAAESLAQFLQVFFVSTTALIPGQTAAALATEIIAVAASVLGIAPPNMMFPSGNVGWFLCVPAKALFPYGNFILPKNANVV